MTINRRLPRALLVDDVVGDIELLASALEDDYEVQFALSGEQALALSESEPPDIMLLDVFMPGMDGLETLRRFRSTPARCNIPVILVTADTRAETELAGFGLGAADFLNKPLELPVVKARTRNVLERHQLLINQQRLVSSLSEANAEIQRLLQFKDLLLSAAGDGIYGIGLDGRCTYVNPAALAKLGFERDEVIGQDTHALFHHHHADGTPFPALECPLHQTMIDGIRREIDDFFICKDQTVLPVHITVTSMNRSNARIGAEVVFQDISERRRMERELFLLATTDTLTEVTNRRRFLELAEAELQRVRRYGGQSGVLMIDLDHFKQVNDEFGHAAGDQVLKHFAHLTKGRLRAVDSLGRIGGEEFAILLPDTSLEGTRIFAQHLCEQIAGERIIAELRQIILTISIGVTQISPADKRIDDVLIRADEAMYAAKHGGRNQVVVTQPPQTKAADCEASGVGNSSAPLPPLPDLDNLLAADSMPVLATQEALARLGNNRSIFIAAAASLPQQIEADLLQIEQAVTDANFDLLRKTTHRLKGSLGLIGAQRALHTCSTLGAMAKSGDTPSIAAGIRQLQRELDLLAPVLTRFLANPDNYLNGEGIR